MTRIAPLNPDELPESIQPVLDFARQTMGFTPNDVLTMARWPDLLQVMAPVVGLVFAPGEVGMELKRLVATIASAAAGCQYCVAHNALGLQQEGVAPEKQAEIWEFESSYAFSQAERAAMHFARGAAQSPATVSEADFIRLRAHFTDQQILEITAVISLFGFLNRWNASLATPLEEAPRRFAEEELGSSGWEAGIHDPGYAAD